MWQVLEADTHMVQRTAMHVCQQALGPQIHTAARAMLTLDFEDLCGEEAEIITWLIVVHRA